MPLFLGTPVGIDVFSTQIYGFIGDRSPADYGGASALSLVLVAVVLALVALQWRILGTRRFTTVGGKSYRTEPWHIGPWRWLGTAFITLYLLVAIVLPLTQLVLGSLQPFFGGGGAYSTVNYEELFADETAVSAMRSTLVVALVGGFVAMVLALAIVYALTHNETRLRRALDAMTWLPYAVPGVVLSLGIAWTFVSIPGVRQLYGSLLVLGTGLVIAVTPIATRAVQPALIQINRELEEASRVSGAGSLRMFAGIVLPLIMPSFLAGWFVVAIVMSGNLAIPILLSSTQRPTVPLLVYQLHTQGDTSQAAALFVVILGGLLGGLLLVTLLVRLLNRWLNRGRSGPPAEPGSLEADALLLDDPSVRTDAQLQTVDER